MEESEVWLYSFADDSRAVATIGAWGGGQGPPHKSVWPPHQTFGKLKYDHTVPEIEHVNREIFK